MDKLLQLLSENSDLSYSEMAVMLNESEEAVKEKKKFLGIF